MPEEPEVLNTVEARQASRRKLNLRVLVFSLVLAAIAAMILYAYFYANTPNPV